MRTHCPKCHGWIYPDDEDPACVNCGYRPPEPFAIGEIVFFKQPHVPQFVGEVKKMNLLENVANVTVIDRNMQRSEVKVQFNNIIAGSYSETYHPRA